MEAYEIHVRGHLSARRCATLTALPAVLLPNGATVLTCWVADQLALHGLLNQLRDLNLPLVLVRYRGHGCLSSSWPYPIEDAEARDA